MTDLLLSRCQLLCDNRAVMRSAMPWDSGMMHTLCANYYTMRGMRADEDAFKAAKMLLRSRVGAFSNFRSTAEKPIAAALDASGNAPELLERALSLYALLKKDFFTSSYLPMAAMILAEHAEPARYEELAHRTRTIYLRMRDEHPMLTSAEDSALCALLALSDRSDDDLIASMETCYQLLKPNFAFSANEVQSLSHVLALTPGNPSEQCNRVLKLYEALADAGCRWSHGYELAVLGVVAMDNRRIDTLVEEIIACDAWLKEQKGFGFFSSVSRGQRLMYAALLTQQDPCGATLAVNAGVAAIIAQEMAMVAVTSACIAASASSSH